MVRMARQPFSIQVGLALLVWSGALTTVTLTTFTASAHSGDLLTPACDLVIAGGNLASLSAAITAAHLNGSASICLLDPTDWPGGQATASAVPAIDFGSANQYPAHSANLPLNFNVFLAAIQTWLPGNETYNPSTCWVSTRCYQPQVAVEQWIMPVLEKYAPNLRVFLNTVVIAAGRDADSGAVTWLAAVQRTPVDNTTGWELPLSASVADWYSPADSPRFTKTVLNFTRMAAVIEATEFGDVLFTARVPVAQVS